MGIFSKKTASYVSEIDKLLAEYDKTHALSPAQRAEVKKYKRIYTLRDHPQPESKNSKIWEEF